MEPREPTADEGDRITELVESSMTTSYRLSPQQIEQITQDEFSEDAVAAKVDDDATVVRVVETDDEVDEAVVAGYVEGTLDGSRGELKWLFVDPEHRGKGIATELYETATETLRENGADQVRATTLEANAEGQEFFDRFGLERVADRNVEVGDESLTEYVYAESSADAETDEEIEEKAEIDETDLPDTETSDGQTTATTEDGKEVFVALDERDSGTEGPFFVTYTDEDHSERYGYYCSNCGSLDVSMDGSDRLECKDCGNDHASRSGESYDDSYL